MKPLPDWRQIQLVAFDLDGTLYDLQRLRWLMLRQLLGHAWQSRSLDTLLTLRTFRRVREALGRADTDAPEATDAALDEATDALAHDAAPPFVDAQYRRTAVAHGKQPAEVAVLAHEWLERRPLPLLAQCRYPHVAALFAGLRAAGIKVAVFSDYPANEKLAALGLEAWPVASATDSDVARLKPDPAGLNLILQKTGISPAQALMIGDRFDRDGAAAQRAGVQALIKSRRPHPQFQTFCAFDDAVFKSFLGAS